MSYIGNEPTSVAFLTDTFSGNGSTTAFTLSAAPAGTSSILVAITGVVQDPSTYSVVGTTLTFSPAPPTGTGNISVRFLGIPASGVTTTAYRTVTEFTATAGQTTFSVPSYTVGFIDVYRNGVMLGSADYTASNGLTVVLASGATAGDLVEVISMSVSSVLNAIPSIPSSVNTTNLVDSSVTTAKIADANVTAVKLASGAALSNLGSSRLARTNMPAGSVLQIVQNIAATAADYSSSTPTLRTSVSITPTASSSRFLLMYVSGDCLANSSSAVYGASWFYRDSTQVQKFTYEMTRGYSPGPWTSFAGNYLDSPATTSAITYAVYHANANSSGIFRVGDSNAPSVLTVMEIAG